MMGRADGMPELILHHYAGSPFGEKIRSILGYKRLSWRSVLIPPTLPRPSLALLTGAYRRTPVLQVGAHVYCDTRCIADFLERRFPEPTLFPEGSRLASDLMSFWAEPRMFVAMAPLRFRRSEDVEGILHGSSSTANFVADRTPFMQGALDVSNIGELTPAAWDQVETLLGVLDRELEQGESYLSGSCPSMCDFAAYHLVWWLDHRPRIGEILDQRPRVCRWLDRMKAVGHGDVKPMEPEESLERARNDAAEIDARADHGDLMGRKLGETVRITADDYGRNTVTGELASAAFEEVVIRRRHADLGDVFLHFPRIGFQILPE